MRCLGVIIPKCVQDVRRQPPVCWPKKADAETLDRITAFGERFGREKNEIIQACNLASGLSDIAIILEMPHERHNYSDPFEDFVQSCHTLAYVDELIRYGSNGARSIHTVTVLDAFSFQPNPGIFNVPGNRRVPSNDCNQLLEEKLKLKRPKVVLCCWADKKRQCSNGFVSQFKSHGIGKGKQLVHIKWDDTVEGQTTAIRSFHPGHLNYKTGDKIHARFLMSCHFTLAFTLLAGQTQEPAWFPRLCDISARYARAAVQPLTRGPDLFPVVAVIRDTLGEILDISRGRRPITYKNVLKEKLEINESIKELLYSPLTDKGWEIARLVVLWEEYDHPEKMQIMDRLEKYGMNKLT